MRIFTLNLLFILLFSNGLHAQNLLANGDFESGGVGVGFNVNGTGYTFVASPTGTTAAGDYSFGINPQPYNTANFITSGDHTTGNGNMMIIDGSSDGGNPSFWKAGNSGGGVCGLTVGATYTFKYWVRSISTNVTGPATQADIRVVFNNATVVTSPASTLAPLTTAGWVQRVYTFTPTNACVNIELRNFNTSFTGNDFAIDDLAVVPPPKPLAVMYSAVSPFCATPATGSISVYGSGGTAPYTNYTISGPVNLSNTTGIFTNVPVGTYTVSVTDTAATTVSQANVVLVAVTNPLTVSPNTNICSGSSTTLTASGGTTYQWTASPSDPSLTTPTSASIFVSPTTTTTYTVTATSTSTRNLVFNGDFSQGNVGFNTDYNYLATNTSGAQGMYGIVTNPSTWFSSFTTCPDHTTGTGTMMVFDGSNTNSGNDRLWTQTIPVQTGQTYTFSYWVQSVSAGNPASIETLINGVPQGTTTAPTVITCGNWTQVTYTWNSGASTSAVIALYDRNLSTAGNDFAIDDIAFTTSVTCSDSRSVVVTIDPNVTLTLTSGSSTASQNVCINTPIVPIQYTFGNGATGVTVTGLPAGVTSSVSGSAVTISGSPSTLTGSPFTYTVTTVGGCGSQTLSGVITVNPNVTLTLSSASTTSNQSVCNNNSITNIVYLLGNGATGATVTGLPPGVTASVSAPVVTISGAPTTVVGSPFTYTVTTTGGCGTQSLTGTITVNTLTITVPSNQTYCNGVTVPTQNFTSNQSGTTFSWTNSNPLITIGSNGNGNINSFLATNNTTVPQVTTITVTGSLDGCLNEVKSYTITVNPSPGVMVNNVVKCEGDISPATMIATPTYPGSYSYSWIVPTGVTSPGNVASFTTLIPGNYSVVITNTITGCSVTSAPGQFSFTLDCCINDISTSTNNQTFCNDTSCTVLNAAYIKSYDTTSYTVKSIPYAPLNPLGNLATALCTQDDRFSDPVTMPFSFSFYGQCYTQFQVGTNTLLTFTVDPTRLCNSGTGSGWAFTQAIPSVAMNALWRNSIYFPMQDTNPAVPSVPPVSINYIVDGVAPCRKLIINVKSMPLFSCGTAQGLQESQLVLHEGTNIIDVHVTRRTVCANWNSGNAVLGLHNSTGTQAITPPNRNTGTWTATNESWRFSPSGAPLTTVRWLQGTSVLGTSESVAVCPTTTTTYTAEVTHNICGGVKKYTEDITIYVNPDDTNPAPSLTNCNPNTIFDLTQNESPVLGPLLATGEYEVYYYTNQSDAQNLAPNYITNPSAYNLTTGTSQIIYMSLNNIFTGCVRVQPFNISMIDCTTCPTITNPSITQVLCLGADVSPLTVNTDTVGANTISYVYFTTPQAGASMYSGGILLGNATPSATGTATYDPGLLGSAGSLPNVPGTYYVYAILNPTPALATCRPFQEIVVNVSSLNGLTLTSAPATTNQTICFGNAITPITYTYDPLATATVTGLPAGVNAIISGGSITITGTPTVFSTTAYTYTVSVTGSLCGSPTTTGTILVQPVTTLVLSSAPATANQTVCENGSITAINYTYGGSATGITVSGLPAGVTSSVTGNVLTITGAPNSSVGSPYTYTVTTTGGNCGTPSMTGTITVNPTTTLVLSSTSGTDTQTVCLNAPITPITYTFAGSATGATVTGLPAGVTSSIAGNTVTITGSPSTVTGSPFTFTVTTTGGACGTPSMTGTITVEPLATLVLTSTGATSNQTVCENSAIATITYTFGGTATGATVTGLPTGVTFAVSGNTLTITGSPTSTTGSPFTYTVSTTGGACGAPTLTGTITVNPITTLSLTSAAGTDNQTVCINGLITPITYTFGGSATGATVTGLPSGLTASVTGSTLTITGSPTTLTGSPFTYTVTTTGGACGTPSLTGTLTVQPLATLALSSPSATTNQTVCINTPITTIEYTFGGTATGASVVGLPAGVTASVAGNTLTISGTPTTNAGSPFNYTVTTTGGNCGAPTLTGTITVNVGATLVLSSSAFLSSQTVCENNAITNIVYTFGGSATGANVTGLPTGVTFTTSGNSIIISGTPSTPSATPYSYTVNTTGGTCGAPTLSGTITVNPNSTLILTSAVGTDNQTLCVNGVLTPITYTFGGSATGATVTGLPAGVTASVTGSTVTISGSPTTTTGSPFTYTVTTTGGACGFPSLTGTITVEPLATLQLTSSAGTNSQTVCINSAISTITYDFGGTATGAVVTGLPAGLTYTVVGNTVSITGSPTTLTGSPFTYTVTTTGGACGTPSLTGTLTVQPLATLMLSSSTATANQTLCVNSAITNIVYTFGGTATGATVTGLPTGVTASVSGSTVTISGSPTTLTGSPFTFTVTTTGGSCGTPSLTGTITVQPLATLTLTSPAATTSQTVCINSAINTITYDFGGTATGAVVTGLPAGVSYSITGKTVSIVGSPSTLTGSPFTYTITTTGGNCGTPSLTGTITVQPTATLVLSSPASTANQTLCVNSSITSIVYTFGGTATGATVTGLPAGVTASVSGSTVTITGSPTTVTGSPFNYTITTTGGSCGTPSLTGTITVRPLATISLTSPTGSDAQSVCAFSSIAVIRYTNGGTATGATVTGLPVGVTASFSGGVTTISGVPTVPGTYPYTITTTGGACGTATLSGSITVIQAPPAATPTPYVVCDDNNDGVACTFILDTKRPEITTNTLVNVTYHLTLTDSQTGSNPIPSNVPFCNNDYDQQTIYIRVFDPAAPACPTLTTLSLVVVPKPVATPPADYHKCDDNTDGIAVFNLNSVVNPQVLGSLAASQHTVTYYISQADALVPQNPLTGTAAYASASTTLWIRVQNNTTGCFDVTSVNLVVDPLPLLPAVGYFPQYEVCETTAPICIESFNLNSQIPMILNGQTGIQVTFYPSLANAISNTNAIANTSSYHNVSLCNQTIGIRLTNTSTGCFVVSTMDLVVNPKPAPNVPTTPYTVCDDNQDGVGQFDLNTLTPGLLLGSTTAYTISYHLTQQDAQTPVNAISLTQPFINNDPFIQIIWVRAEDPTTGCFTVVPVTLKVNIAPIAPVNLPTINNCDVDSNPQDGCTTFNLAAQTPAVLAQQTTAANNYTVTYYTSQADASASPAGINPIVNTTNYTACGTTTIWVRVEHKSSHCFAVGSFDVQVNTSLVLTTPTLYALCDDDAQPNNQFTSFDLVSFVGTVPGHTLAFYLNAAHTQPITNPSAFTNTIPANQTIFVVATDTATGCKSYRTLTVRVLPVPTPRTNPPALAPKCDVTNPGDGVEIFDLTVNAAYILNNQANVSLHYFYTQADAANNVNEITLPTAANVGSNVWIRVESNLNIDSFSQHCYVLVEQALTVNPLPTLVQPVADYQECDDDTDNITAFNLTAWGQANLLTGNALPLSNYSLSFYEDAALTQLIANPGNYQNTSNPQTLWVTATNTTTGCRSVVGSFNILVNPKPLATAPSSYDSCDTDGTNDGYFNLDLTPYETIALAGQPATDFEVSFYNTQLDAQNETNAITNWTGYMAYTHTVWIRVENNLTGCARLVSFAVTIERLPEPVIETANNSHVICVDFISGQVVRPLLLTASNLIPGTFTYEWYEASNPTTVIGTGATYLVDSAEANGATRNYTVVMTSTSALGCNQTSASFDVIQSGQAVVPTGTVGYVVTNAFSDLQTITVNVDGYGTYEYSLDDGPRQTSNVFENVPLGEHTVTVWDTEGGMDNSCDPLVISGVSIIDYPHYFTPNGDGIHDTWNIVGLQNQPAAKIYIFDRYGKLLKQISPTSPGWDGTYNGYLAPSTDYWFTVEYLEGGTMKEFKAHFSLKR